eukprot:403365460
MIRFLRSERALEIHATSPINIALVKYWGKLDEEYIIPLNSSLSITVDQNDLCSRTLVKLVYDQDMNDLSEPKVTLILNGKSEKITHRIMNVINTIRKRAQSVKAYDVEGSAEDNNQQYIDIPKEDLLKMRIELSYMEFKSSSKVNIQHSQDSAQVVLVDPFMEDLFNGMLALKAWQI